MNSKYVLSILIVVIAIVLAINIISVSVYADEAKKPEEKWAGIDETVIEKFAEEAGRPARDPYINVGQGDMLLFCFLIAGIVGGFVFGYYFRVLFKEERKPAK